MINAKKKTWTNPDVIVGRLNSGKTLLYNVYNRNKRQRVMTLYANAIRVCDSIVTFYLDGEEIAHYDNKECYHLGMEVENDAEYNVLL